jgi:type VI secretion system secreted protein Hcp
MYRSPWKKGLPVACLCATLLALSPASAALNSYLILTGQAQGLIQGSVTQAGRQGQILVIAFDHELKAPFDAATGQPSGRRQHGVLTITKELDRSTPLLYRALASNENIPTWELRCWKPSPTGAEQQHYTVKLTNARIVGIKQQMPNNKDPNLVRYETYEQVSFTYQTIQWTWNDGGITATDTRQ